MTSVRIAPVSNAAAESGVAAEAVEAGRSHVTDAELDRLAAEMDDPTQWGDVEEVGPGFYRAPGVARQLGQAIAAYRARHGLTQQELGRALFLHESQIARLEGADHTPAIETLVRVAQHLGLTLTVQVTPTGASLTVAEAAHAANTPTPGSA